jgi:hypothetical protein
VNRIVDDRNIHLSPVAIHIAASFTVILGFDHSHKAKILKSTTKLATEKE